MIPYGLGPNGLAEGTGMSVAEARGTLQKHKQRFPRVWSFIDHVKLTAKKNGYIKMLFGRRRRLPDIYSSDKGIAASAERQSVNNKIQGSAGDLMKGAMIKLHFDVLPLYGAKLLIQVHDELLITCPKETADECAKAVKETMINVVQLKVPLDASVSISQNWSTGH